MWHIKGATICCLFSLHLYSICVSAGLQTNPERQICIDYEFRVEIRATEKHTRLTWSGYISPPTDSIGWFFTMKLKEGLTRVVRLGKKASLYGFDLYGGAIREDSARFRRFLYHELRAYLDRVPSVGLLLISEKTIITHIKQLLYIYISIYKYIYI